MLIGTYESGQKAATELYKRGYRWMGLTQYLHNHRIHETLEFVRGFQHIIDSLPDEDIPEYQGRIFP